MKIMDNKIMMDPDKYGYIQCPHCNGYGSSFKDQKWQKNNLNIIIKIYII